MSKKNPMHRRAAWHDYRSRSMYMITLKKREGTPRFCSIGNIGTPRKMIAGVELTQAGTCLWAQKEPWLAEFDALRVLTMIVMPDHVHMLLYVTARTQKHLSTIISIYKLNCNRELGYVVFDPDYNDKIVFAEGHREAFYRYINDNPRRYLARRLHSEYFLRVQRFVIDGREYSLFGNLFLLNNPDKTVVRYSSRFTEQERAAKAREYDEAMRTRGVLVSPFIHPDERAVRDRGVEAGCSLIKVVQNGFGERFKPAGADFDLCAAGRLLLIGPAQHSTRSVDLTRAAAMSANAVAEAIVAHPAVWQI